MAVNLTDVYGGGIRMVPSGRAMFDFMYCDYVYVLKNGRVVAHGETEDVITEQLIRDVYEVDCAVQRQPRNGKLYVTYFSRI